LHDNGSRVQNAGALKGIVLGDDARKRYSDDPRLRIEVREFAYPSIASLPGVPARSRDIRGD
jgi:hypothetical protein